MEVLSSRFIVRCADLERSVAFWTETVGLRISREYGAGGVRTGVVLFCGSGFLELTGGGRTDGTDGTDRSPSIRSAPALWLQVPDVDLEVARLRALGVAVSDARTEPWGLREAWLTVPDGLRAVLVTVPADHPIRRRLDP